MPDGWSCRYPPAPGCPGGIPGGHAGEQARLLQAAYSESQMHRSNPYKSGVALPPEVKYDPGISQSHSQQIKSILSNDVRLSSIDHMSSSSGATLSPSSSSSTHSSANLASRGLATHTSFYPCAGFLGRQGNFLSSGIQLPSRTTKNLPEAWKSGTTDKVVGWEDCSRLPQLTEESLLNNLATRYQCGHIYVGGNYLYFYS